MNLQLRLILMASCIAIATTIVTALMIANQAILQMEREALEQQSINLRAKQVLVGNNISSYLKTIEHQAIAMAFDQATVRATIDFIAASENDDALTDPADDIVMADSVRNYYQRQFKVKYDAQNPAPIDVAPLYKGLSTKTITRQYRYISNSDLPLGEKDGLERRGDGTTYDALHSQYHPSIRTFLQEFGYYDIFIVDAKSGDVVYSVFKELDFATSLKSGPYQNTGLGEAFKQALSLASGETYLTDFAAYGPSYDQPASFISTPIQKAGITVGILIFQMPIDRLNTIMTQNGEWASNGFGNSGEIYLVGPDKTLRNESRFFIEDPASYLSTLAKAGISQHIDIRAKQTGISLQPVETAGVTSALAGNTGFEMFADYRGIPVLSAYSPIKIGDMTWAILSQIDKAEAFAASRALASSILQVTMFTLLVVAVAAIGTSVFMARHLIRPLARLAYWLEAMSEGDADLTQRIKPVGIPEIDRISKGVNDFSELLRHILNRVIDTSYEISATSTKLHATMASTHSTVKRQAVDIHAIGSAVKLFVTAVKEVTEKTKIASQATGEARASAESNADTARLASSNIQQLVDEVNASSATLRNLQDQVTSIDEVLNLIDAIADQTNLLALNAAIEAARAGEQGRGFAVVADEVRTLAARTQESTVTIQNKMALLNTSVGSSVESMSRAAISAKGGIHLVESVSRTLIKLSDHVTALAAVNASITDASQLQIMTISDIHSSIGRLTSQADELATSSSDIIAAAQNLSNIADALNEIMSRFKT